MSIGKNSYVKTHPQMKKYAEQVGTPNRIFLHAEIDAIIKCRDLSKAFKIVVIRKKNDKTLLAKPCPICMAAIQDAGIKIIEWSI